MWVLLFLAAIFHFYIMYKIFNGGSASKANNVDSVAKTNNVDSSDVEESFDDKFAKKIYYKCRDLGITSITSKENVEKLMVVANSFGVKKVTDAKKLYRRAKQCIKEEKLEEEREIFELRKEKESDDFKCEKEKSILVGRDKYKKLCELHTWEGKYKFSNDLDNALYDCTNVEEKFELLDFSDVDCHIMSTGNFIVSFYIHLKEKIMLLDRDAILDGAIKVSILDEDDNIVAIGYLNGNVDKLKVSPSYVSYNLKGFKTGYYSVLCCFVNGASYDEDKEYYVEFCPINLWFIEHIFPSDENKI